MATTPRSTANVSREVNDRNKGYTRVVFQQGVPVFDVDLTTAQVLSSEQTVNATHASEGYADMGAFGQAGAFVPLDSTPTSVRNTQNYGVVKGVINTRLGPVDMLRGGIGKPVLPFSHYNLVGTASVLSEDGDYDNYVLRGITTAGTAVNTVEDASKSFSDVHGLVAQSVDIDVTWASGAIDDDGDGASSSTSMTLGDPGCAVVMLDGANAGLVRAVIAISSPTKLQVAPFPNTVAAGTSYAIVPLNVFQLSTFVSALAGVGLAEEPPILISALQAFEEDICAYEDTSLEHPARAGQDVSHRNQLRWCVRTLYVLTDNPIDQLGSASAFSALLRSRQPLFAAANDVNAKARDAVRHDATGLRVSNTLPEPYWPQIRTAKIAPHRSLMQAFGMLAEAQLFGGDGVVVPLFLLRPAARSRTSYGTSLHPGYVGTATVQPLFCLRPKYLPDGNRPYRPSIFVQREGTRLSGGQTASILMQMAGLGVPPSTYDAGLFYDSNGRELAFDNAARAAQHTQRLAIAALGVGQDWGRQDDGTNYIGLAGLPTSPLLISDGREEGEIAFSGAGQPSTETLPASVDGIMAGITSIPGVVVPIALVNTTAFNVQDVFGGSVDLRFSAGIGLSSYYLRNGVEIEFDGPNGWSFFTEDAEEDQVNIRRVREPHEGIVQAARMQESLLWRQLAIKSTAHEAADLFTYYVPNVPTVIDSFEEPLLANQYSVAAVGALQTSLTTETDYQDGLSWDQRESYTLGGSRLLGAGPTSALSYGQFTRLGDAETASEGVEFNPALHPKDPELRGAVSLEAATGIDSNNPDAISENGAWGRGTATKIQAGLISTSTLDQRCTSMRLRYHIGDYYPAPDGSNALVTSLMLYTRFEQLSLVHWATMPKHQHPVLAKSLSSYAGVISALTGLVVKGDDTHLIDGDGAPLMQEESPQGSEEPGDIDWTTLPFGHEHQPFVHWYHPMQEYITSPHPGGIDFYDATTRKIAYSKFGERSLVIPSMTVPFSAGENANVEGADNWGNLAAPVDVIGAHFNLREPSITPVVPGQPTAVVVNLGDGGTVTVKSKGIYFPFNPLDADREPGAFTIREEGIPGPVFMPAHRQYAYGTDWDVDDNREFGFHPVFDAVDTDLSAEWGYFPRIDGVRGNLPDWEETSGGPTTDSAWRWNMPVLRSAIRTDTLAAIVRGMRGKAELVLGATVAAYNAAKWSGPDRTTDTAFVGGLGTSVARGDSDWAGGPSTLTQMISTLYTNPLLLGGRWDLEDGDMMPLGSRRGTPIDDVFQLAYYERFTAAAADGGAEATSFNPLMNTLAAIRYMGMQQKLLWNSSFRVLHVRPGGGADPVAGGYSRRIASSAPKSLTELFVVRNRQTGEPIQWPQGPTDKNAKIYLHFESMHPTAAGGVVVDGVTLQEHPNHEFIGHLYPMISDSMGGGPSAGAGDDLRDDISDSVANVIVDKSFFTPREVYTGLTGDTFMADPFDFECAKAAADEEEDPTLMKVSKRDRNAENSGIEIDLLNELRIVRANAADYGLDQVGFAGKTWLDMMPTPADLTDPGDHEIVFVLYTGAAGQKMIDPNVPDSYNPPIAGCKVTATLEVNRPTERRSSDGDATGLHYGQTKRTSHVLGHA